MRDPRIQALMRWLPYALALSLVLPPASVLKLSQQLLRAVLRLLRPATAARVLSQLPPRTSAHEKAPSQQAQQGPYPAALLYEVQLSELLPWAPLLPQQVLQGIQPGLTTAPSHLLSGVSQQDTSKHSTQQVHHTSKNSALYSTLCEGAELEADVDEALDAVRVLKSFAPNPTGLAAALISMQTRMQRLEDQERCAAVKAAVSEAIVNVLKAHAQQESSSHKPAVGAEVAMCHSEAQTSLPTTPRNCGTMPPELDTMDVQALDQDKAEAQAQHSVREGSKPLEVRETSSLEAAPIAPCSVSDTHVGSSPPDVVRAV